METQEKKGIVVALFDMVKDAHTEIDELRLQIALGKAEAKDLFEESKKKFNASLQELKEKLTTAKSNKELLSLIHTLETQLSSGIAETTELFKEQQKKIANALTELEKKIEQNELLKDVQSKLRLEHEKFKIKLELLELHYKLEKIAIAYNFEQKKADFFSKLAEIKSKILNNGDKAKENWEHFQAELNEAYKHLKQAFTK